MNIVDYRTIGVPTFSRGIAICLLMPWFILSVRELYDRDHRGNDRGSDPVYCRNPFPVNMHQITFADVNLGHGQIWEVDPDESEVTRLEVLGESDGMRRI